LLVLVQLVIAAITTEPSVRASAGAAGPGAICSVALLPSPQTPTSFSPAGMVTAASLPVCSGSLDPA
jgi:hypothetical protein